ncbi:DUF262 domain-containing protein [Bradyrhizobium sp. SZCCHNRI2007]|uniref:DUF262 domain-containing protein n=1 Tax=Bradyrhizobium sp. SZCCHNRI2007 TaxID=3057281 RepID=UPI0028E53EF4|nr:DUF262 domain-containing protein [Bradyrhizobium sp. SZCCHNRI2007]
MTSSSFPPRPSVEHLLTIFRRIDARKILVPAFQRTFVWKESQIIDLLESVYSGYPVGSILLWTIDREILRISDADDVPFPRGVPQYPVDFVLDGLQRLSSLYGVFHFGTATKNLKFDVGFDLKEHLFVHSHQFEGERELFVPLNALFNPRALLDVQQRLLKVSNSGDELIQTVLSLQSRFQEYMLPLVTLTERDPGEVVSIFERVNNTGTKLSRVDFMRAITWSSDFDLNDALEEMESWLSNFNFDLSDDTIVKAIGLTFNLDPLPDVMLSLREKSADDLDNAVQETKSSFDQTILFLREHLNIFGSDFVPYEGQILTLFNVFHKLHKIDEESAIHLKQWFFATSVSEALQGRPDHFVAKQIRTITTRIKEKRFFEFRNDAFTRNASGLADAGLKRLIKGKALSTAFVEMLGQKQARSLVDGRIIDPEEYLRVFETASFVPIFPKSALLEFGGEISSPKILANVLLVPPSDAAALRGADLRKVLLDWYSRSKDEWTPVLGSQMLPLSEDLLKDGRDITFLEWRADAVADALRDWIFF